MPYAKRTTSIVAVLVVLLGLVAAASATPAKKPPPSPLKSLVAQLDGKTLKQREASLLALAKQQGGTVSWYTSLSKSIYPKVIDAFQAKYPGVKIDVYRASSEDVTAKLYQEASAGTSGADVVETNGTELTFFQHKKDILVPYRGSPYAKAVPSVYRFDTWTADRLEAFVLAWNTDLVPSGQQPKGWTDLVDARWKGKLEMEPGDVDWFAAAYLWLEQQQLAKLKPRPKTKAARAKALKKIDAKIDALFAGIAKNAQIVPGHTEEATFLAAGQYAVCLSCHAQSVEALAQDKHAPITFAPFAAPPVIRAQGVGIAYRLKHPAAALLFYDWLLRKDGGQKALLDGGANPSLPAMADPQLRAKTRIQLNLRPIVAQFGAWSDKYDKIVRLGAGG